MKRIMICQSRVGKTPQEIKKERDSAISAISAMGAIAVIVNHVPEWDNPEWLASNHIINKQIFIESKNTQLLSTVDAVYCCMGFEQDPIAVEVIRVAREYKIDVLDS